ncbi:baeRF10 domain-containing protein [Oryzihumus sp.]
MIARAALDRLLDFRADGGPPVVSVYAAAPVDPKEKVHVRARVNSLLQGLDPLVENRELDRETRLSIRQDIERLREVVADEHWRPHGVGLFCCSARDFFESVELPREPRERALVDATPWVRPIAAMIDKDHRVCVVTLDRGHAVLWEHRVGRDDELVRIDEVEDRVLRDADHTGGRFGGQEYTTHHKVTELAKKHFRHVIARLEKLFFPELDHEVQYEEVVEGRSPRDVGADESYDLLVVAGHGERVSGFLEELPDRLRQRLAGTFTDPSVDDRKALEVQVDEVLERWERDREQQGVEHVLEVEAMGGLGVTGLHTCLWAASSKAIDTLFLREQDEAPGVVCDGCGWLGEEGEVCPVDGRPLRRTPDIVDEMLQSVLRDSGTVHTLEDGVAPEARSPLAHLRFPLPPEPPG